MYDIRPVIVTPVNKIGLNFFQVNNSSFTNNDMTGGFSHGMRFDGSNTNNLYDNNDMSGCTSHALYLNGGTNNGHTITNNNLTGSTGGNALLYRYGTPTDVSDNDFTNSRSGFFLAGANGFVIDPPGSGGQNENIYGNHVDAVLTVQFSNDITINNWAMAPLFVTPVNKIGLNFFQVNNSSFTNNDMTGGFSHGMRFDGSNTNNTYRVTRRLTSSGDTRTSPPPGHRPALVSRSSSAGLPWEAQAGPTSPPTSSASK